VPATPFPPDAVVDEFYRDVRAQSGEVWLGIDFRANGLLDQWCGAGPARGRLPVRTGENGTVTAYLVAGAPLS
jgi:hypothetical protein